MLVFSIFLYTVFVMSITSVVPWVLQYMHTLYIYISMVLEILLNIYRDLFKNYLNTSTKYILITK
jgi:hypothetical protein